MTLEKGVAANLVFKSLGFIGRVAKTASKKLSDDHDDTNDVDDGDGSDCDNDVDGGDDVTMVMTTMTMTMTMMTTRKACKPT
jgi:hypothetical protein